MENSIFSGSENLYKYLVTIGLLLIVMTVYYPLKEKQELEILSIKIEHDSSILNYKINENAKNVNVLKKVISQQGVNEQTKSMLNEIDRLNKENTINQFESEKKYEELKCRSRYINLYNWLFWVFFPTGIGLSIFGFIKWKDAKKYDDNLLKLENEKLELEVQKLRREQNTP